MVVPLPPLKFRKRNGEEVTIDDTRLADLIEWLADEGKTYVPPADKAEKVALTINCHGRTIWATPAPLLKVA